MTPELKALITMMEMLADHHRELRVCIAAQREAIRTAAIDELTAACRRTQEISIAASDLERQRLDLVTAVTRTREPNRTDPLTLEEIASRLGEDDRAALLDAAAKLREEITGAQRESSIVAAAATALSRHMAGIREKIHGALSRVGVYERRGRIAVGSRMDCCIDLTT
ncbi:MAG: flagellar export chaperone FlgN [Planctomycetota bacterium]|jgi:hypothetical protein